MSRTPAVLRAPPTVGLADLALAASIMAFNPPVDLVLGTPRLMPMAR
jgi:hypothetical protein